MFVCKLPGGIRLNGSVCSEITLREMSGVEEDILLDQRKKGNSLLVSASRRFSEVLALCTVSIGDTRSDDNLSPAKASRAPFLAFWESALVGDRARALVALRELSLGPTYVFSEQCPACRVEIPRVTVALDELTVTPYFRHLDEESRSSALAQPSHTGELPSGRPFEWRFLNGKDEDTLEEAFSGSLKNTPDRLATVLTAIRLVSVGGEPVRDEKGKLRDVVRYMSAKDRAFVRSYFDDVDGGIDNMIDIECESCGAKFQRQLDISKPSFFFPSGIK